MNKEIIKRIKQEISEKSLPGDFPVKIIAVDGHGGAGKSTAAEALAGELNAEIIHTDDFASWDNPLDWWPRFINEIIKPIKSGAKSLSYKRGSWYKNHRPEPVKDQPVTSIIILEGVSASRREFRPYLTYAIWVETPIDVCMERGIARDLENKESGKTHEEILQDWKKWHRYENEYIAKDNPKEYVDIEISGAS